jgi:hypothetical protein
MKKLTLLLFCKSLVFFSYSQTDLEKLLSQKQSLPNDWISLITKQPKWNVADWTMIGDQSRKVYPPNAAWKENAKASTYQFTVSNVSKFPFIADSLNTLPAVYFSEEGTFYIVHTIIIEKKTIELKYPFKVHYLDSTKVVLEHLNDILFDFDTGKTLSKEELKKKMSERSKNPPGSYDVIDKSKKRGKSEEEVRMVELLLTAID